MFNRAVQEFARERRFAQAHHDFAARRIVRRGRSAYT